MVESSFRWGFEVRCGHRSGVFGAVSTANSVMVAVKTIGEFGGIRWRTEGDAAIRVRVRRAFEIGIRRPKRIHSLSEQRVG